MEILETWCLELSEVVDIYDAQNAYFDLPESNRRRFMFHCSIVPLFHEDCRRMRNRLVSRVNYHRLAKETDKYRQPHFRAPAANEHLLTCIWYEPAGAAVSTTSSGDENRPAHRAGEEN